MVASSDVTNYVRGAWLRNNQWRTLYKDKPPNKQKLVLTSFVASA